MHDSTRTSNQKRPPPIVGDLRESSGSLFSAVSLAFSEVAQHSVQLTVGTHRVFEHFLAFGFFRFEGESTLPPTAANASRWAALGQVEDGYGSDRSGLE